MPPLTPRPAAAKRHRDQIRTLANLLTDDTIDELCRRAEQPHAHDGYPTSTLGEGTGGDTPNPTLRAVELSAGGHGYDHDTWLTPADPTGQAIRELFAQLAEAAGLLTIIDRSRQYVFAQEAKVRGRQNTVDLCAGCDQPAVKVKRLDGDPYHHPDPIGGEPQPQCWWDAYRAKRRDAC